MGMYSINLVHLFIYCYKKWEEEDDDAKKISRLNALSFTGLVIAWKAWKEKHMIKGNRDGPAKNPPMLKLVSLLNSGVSTFWELSKKLTFIWCEWVFI